MKFEFLDFETNELLATMPEGTFKEAKEEQKRLEEECNCVVRVLR